MSKLITVIFLSITEEKLISNCTVVKKGMPFLIYDINPKTQVCIYMLSM